MIICIRAPWRAARQKDANLRSPERAFPGSPAARTSATPSPSLQQDIVGEDDLLVPGQTTPIIANRRPALADTITQRDARDVSLCY